MNLNDSAHFSCCTPHPRRAFLADFGMGFTGLVLSAVLAGDGVRRAVAEEPPPAEPLPAPRAKSVIWIFL
ncbi:MAG: hypothetical protein ACK6D3_20595, partial [Planctomycetaceae bacterium]